MKEETTVIEAHSISLSCIKLFLFIYAKENAVFHFTAPLIFNHFLGIPMQDPQRLLGEPLGLLLSL